MSSSFSSITWKFSLVNLGDIGPHQAQKETITNSELRSCQSQLPFHRFEWLLTSVHLISTNCKSHSSPLQYQAFTEQFGMAEICRHLATYFFYTTSQQHRSLGVKQTAYRILSSVGSLFVAPLDLSFRPKASSPIGGTEGGFPCLAFLWRWT